LISSLDNALNSSDFRKPKLQDPLPIIPPVLLFLSGSFYDSMVSWLDFRASALRSFMRNASKEMMISLTTSDSFRF